jgi:hypothetical protein
VADKSRAANRLLVERSFRVIVVLECWVGRLPHGDLGSFKGPRV